MRSFSVILCCVLLVGGMVVEAGCSPYGYAAAKRKQRKIQRAGKKGRPCPCTMNLLPTPPDTIEHTTQWASVGE